MLVALGTPIRGEPKPWKYFKVEAIMINAWEIMSSPYLKRAVVEGKLRDILDFDGTLFCDSGAFQAFKKGVEITVEEVDRIYRSVEADFYFNLDVIPNIDDDEEERQKKMKKTFENFEKLSKSHNVIFVVHPPTAQAVFMAEQINSDYIAVGGLVPYSVHYRQKSSKKMIVDTIWAIKKRKHVLGIGSPSFQPTLKVLDVYSTDSAHWRRAAAYGFILHPVHGSQRHISERPYTAWNPKSEEFSCECPVCKNGVPEEIKESFSLKAIHNAYVTLYGRDINPIGTMKLVLEYARRLKSGEYVPKVQERLDSYLKTR
jgi:tRNA-guanine family transglycosylase